MTAGAWSEPGRNGATLETVLDLLGSAGCPRITLVTADLAPSYGKALRARVPQTRTAYCRTGFTSNGWRPTQFAGRSDTVWGR